MSNLRSDCLDLVKDLPPGDVMRAHVERLCHQIDTLEERWHRANQRIRDIRAAMEQIVIHEGTDQGVILKDHESPTHFDPELKIQVYDHENFSELGDALIAVHRMCEMVLE